MKKVDKDYVDNYFMQQEKVLARLKEIAQLMYEEGDYNYGPYNVGWRDELIEQWDHSSVILKLSCPEPYEDWDNEEEYVIPLWYLDASDSEIRADVRGKKNEVDDRDLRDAIERLKREAKQLGFSLVKVGEDYEFNT